MILVSAFIALLLFLIWIGLIFIRKSLWDVVHQNLIDMEDNFSGKIIRNGFAARPVFHGKMNGEDLTINFSTARTKSGRKTYINITSTLKRDLSLTITEKNWLLEQNDKIPENGREINVNEKYNYIIMTGINKQSDQLIGNEKFKDALRNSDNLAYLFIGKSGTICEFWSAQIDKDTQFDRMKSRLENIQTLMEKIQ
jgi:hypothetical protein